MDDYSHDFLHQQIVWLGNILITVRNMVRVAVYQFRFFVLFSDVYPGLSRGQQPEQGDPDVLLPDPFPSRLGDIISPACPGSPP